MPLLCFVCSAGSLVLPFSLSFLCFSPEPFPLPFKNTDQGNRSFLPHLDTTCLPHTCPPLSASSCTAQDHSCLVAHKPPLTDSPFPLPLRSPQRMPCMFLPFPAAFTHTYTHAHTPTCISPSRHPTHTLHMIYGYQLYLRFLSSILIFAGICIFFSYSFFV